MPQPSDNSSNNTSNTSLNSLANNSLNKRNRISSNGYSIESRVFHVIDASEVELRPVEIAIKIYNDGTEGWTSKKITKGQHTTVRGACAKLLQKGLVVQPYPGAYCNKITHGLRFVPLCMHNVSLEANVCQPIKHWETDEFSGGVKIHVCFGKERRKVTGYVACDVGGMSHDACTLALNRWFDIVERRLGFALNDLVIKTVEFNKDYHGFRIDGVQCVTKRDLYGIIDRTYQKEENVIRRERKLTQPMSMNKFETEIQRGLGEIGKAQEVFEIKKELSEVKETLKFTNSRLLDYQRLFEAMYKQQIGEGGSTKVQPLNRGSDYST